ncbi:MAG: LuxR C-terminal-related transcriptional regulator [Aquihabitans sp.]
MTVGSGGTWPVVGIDHHLRRIGTVISSPSVLGVLLDGPAGVGKSSLASAYSSMKRADGAAVVHVVATPARSTTPFGALVNLAAQAPAAGTADRLATLTAVAAAVETAIHSEATAGPTLLVIDDLPLLDPASADLIVDLARRGIVQILATARRTETVPIEFTGMLVDGTLLRHRVEPLTDDLIVLAAEQMLGGCLNPSTAAQLVASSQGLPLHARELVLTNLATGRLLEYPDGWRFEGLPSAPPSLVELVASRFATMTDEHRRVLEALALAEPVPLAVAAALADPTVLAALEGNELISADEDAGIAIVRLGHPLYAEVVRSRLGQLRIREAALTAVTAMESVADPDVRFRATCLRLDHGLPVAADQAVAAARQALSMVEPDLAARLAINGGDGFDPAFILATALIALGRIDDADAALQRAFDAASNDAERARVISRRGNNLGTAGGRFQESIQVLETGLASLTDPVWRSFVAADLAYARLWNGQVAESQVGIDGAEAKPDAVRANECLVGAVVAVMRGELDRTEALVQEGLPLAPAIRDDVPTARELLTLSRFLAFAFGGRQQEATAVVDAELERASNRGEAASGTWMAVRSIQALVDGRATDALADSGEAARRLAVADISGLRPVAQAVMATALARLGRSSESAATSATVDPAWATETKVRLQLEVAEAWRTAMEGDTSTASARLAAAAGKAMAANHIPLGAIAAYDAVRLGHPRLVVDLLNDAARSWDGPTGPAFVAHAGALIASDPGALMDLASRLPGMGFSLAGAEAAAQASRLYEQSGFTADAMRADFLAACTAAQLGQVDSPGLGQPRGLTAREREVAELAATGTSSRDIGRQLDISARTVDNHLSAVFRKVGVSNRAGLVGVLPLLANLPTSG